MAKDEEKDGKPGIKKHIFQPNGMTLLGLLIGILAGYLIWGNKKEKKA